MAFYLLARQIGFPAAGIGIALLAIFREWNSLWLSSVTRVSNPRTLMTDLPTLLLLLLVAWSATRWLERPQASRAVWSGGLFGLLLLLRTQSLLLLPFLLLIFLLEQRSRHSRHNLMLFLIGTGCVILPWLLHNYLQSGFLAFDDPSQLGLLASQYSDHPLTPTPIDKNPIGLLFTHLLQQPGMVFGAVLNHTFATLIGGFLAPPFQNVLAQGRYDLDWALGFLLGCGFLPWIAQELVPSRYPSALSSPSVARQMLLTLGISEAPAEAAFQRLELREGRLLYPRFLSKGNGLGGTNPWPAYAPREYPRLGFVLLNQESGQVVLPLRNAIRFPSQGVDVLVLGCKQADHFRAVLLAVPQENLLLQSDLPEWSCP